MVDTSPDRKVLLSAAEVVDLVEEQLSWLAVADECVHDFREVTRSPFFVDHFQSAEPWVSLGGEDAGTIEADGVTAGGPIDSIKALQNVRPEDFLRVAATFLRDLRRPFRVARIDEVTDGYNMSSFALLPKAQSIKSGPLRGWRNLWAQTVVLKRDQPPSAGSVSVTPFAMRPDLGDVRHVNGSRLDPGVQRGLAFLAADQCVRESAWLVELSLSPERTGVALQTDAVGARSLLESLGRNADRKALVHWVREHYRKRRAGSDKTLVRAHLRGTQVAVTRHFFATVRPSVVDIDRACNGKRFE